MRVSAIVMTAVVWTWAGVARADVVYSNLSAPLGNYLGGFAYQEAADDVTLGPGARVFESARVAYAGFNFDGDETLTLSLYEMNGAPTSGSFGFNTPGTLLFAATIPIMATDGTVVTFVDPSGAVVLPDNVGVGLAFGGVEFDPTGAGADAGPLLYHPPATGSSLVDYWLRGFPNPGDPWGLFTFGGNPPINFGVEISTVREAVPEPGLMVLLGVGLAGVAARRGRRAVRRS